MLLAAWTGSPAAVTMASCDESASLDPAAAPEADKESTVSGGLMMGPSVELTPEQLTELGLPAEYCPKSCRLCGCHSSSPNPFFGHADTKAWKNFLPWSSGTWKAPRGELCRVCTYVFAHGGFSTLFPKMKDYANHVKKCPEDHAEFRDARAKYIDMKLQNPTLVLRDSKDLWPARIVTLVKSRDSKISKPQTYFMELERFEEKYGRAKPDIVVQKTFGGRTMRGVIVTKHKDHYHWLPLNCFIHPMPTSGF